MYFHLYKELKILPLYHKDHNWMGHYTEAGCYTVHGIFIIDNNSQIMCYTNLHILSPHHIHVDNVLYYRYYNHSLIDSSRVHYNTHLIIIQD